MKLLPARGDIQAWGLVRLPLRALRLVAFCLLALCLVGSPAAAEQPEQPQGAQPEQAAKPKPEKPQPKAADLRYGHVLISAGGGLWVPSASLVPAGLGLTPLDAGGDARLRVGVGVNGYLVLFGEGGVSYATGGIGCARCGATSASAGLGLSAHLTQGFAVDPWISYGAGYRHTLLRVDDVPGAVSSSALPSLDFARVYLGFDYFPTPVFGFGPYLGTDAGLYDFAAPVVYADFQLGMRVTFDPLRAGTRLTFSASR